MKASMRSGLSRVEKDGLPDDQPLHPVGEVGHRDADATANASVLVLCINYHSEEETCRFVRAVCSQYFEGDLNVLVVDNSEDEESRQALAHIEGERIQVIHTPRNVGYFGGAAFGLRAYLESHNLPNWIVVSNSDIMFEDRRFFDRLCRLHYEEEYAVLAPKIMSELTFGDQNPYMRRRVKKWRVQFYEQVARSHLIFNVYEVLAHLKRAAKGVVQRIAEPREQREDRLQVIYAPHGSFIVFNRKYFEDGGDLDYEPFLYNEEVFVAESARRMGHEVVYEPRLRVRHDEHRTTGLIKSPRVVRWIHEARVYWLEEYYS